MTTPELPPLPKVQPVLMDDMELGIIPNEFKEYRAAVEARERILMARIAELSDERDGALRKAVSANKHKQITDKQKQKYVYVTSLAELAAAGNEQAFSCIIPCAKLARDPAASLRDVMNTALANSGGLFGKMTDPYFEAEQANAARGAK